MEVYKLHWGICKKESLEKLFNKLDKLDSFHPTIKFTTGYSWETIIHVNIRLAGLGAHEKAHLFVKPTNTHQFKIKAPLTLIIAKKEFHIVKLYGSIEFLLTTKVLINVGMV